MAKIYTTDREIQRKRGVHTVYTGNGAHVGSKEHQVKGTTFYLGVAKEVEGQEANKLKDLGHAADAKLSSDED